MKEEDFDNLRQRFLLLPELLLERGREGEKTW